MPIIPKLDAGISPNVPGVRVQEDASISQAVADVGANFLRITSDIDARLAQSEAISEATRRNLEDQLAAEDKMRELSLKNPSGYVIDQNGKQIKTISDEFYDWSNERFKTNSKNMSTRSAQELYMEAATKNFSASFAKVKNEEFNLRKNAWNADNTEGLQRELNVLSSNGPLVPHPTMPGKQIVSPNIAFKIYDSRMQNLAGATGVLLNIEESAKLKREIGSSVAGQFFESALTSALTAPKTGITRSEIIQQALQSLDGNDPEQIDRQKRGMSTLTSMMSPTQHEEIKRRLLSIKDTVKEMGMRDLREKHYNAMVKLKSGDDTVNIWPLLSEGKKAFTENQMTSFEWANFANDLIAMKNGVGVYKSIDYLMSSESQKDAMKKDAENKFIAQAKAFLGPDFYAKYPYVSEPALQEFKSVLDTLDDKTEKDFKSDPIGIWGAQLPSVSAYNSKIATQRFLSNPATATPLQIALIDKRFTELQPRVSQYTGLKNSSFGPLAKNDSELGALSGFVNGTQNSDVIAKGLRNIFQNSRHYQGIIEQMISSKKVSPGFRFTLYAGRDIDRMTAIVNAIKNKDKIDDTVKQLENGSSTLTEIRGAVATYSRPYFTERMNMNPNNPEIVSEINQMSDVITAHALTQKRINPSLSNDGLAKQATEYIMGDRVKFQGAVRGHPVTLPKMSNNSDPTEDERFYMSLRLDNLIRSPDELIQKYGASLPERGIENMPGISFKGFWEDVNSSARPVQNDRGDYNIIYRTYTGVDVRLMTNKKDKMGNYIPVTIPASDINKPIQDNERTFLQRIFGIKPQVSAPAPTPAQGENTNPMTDMGIQ